MRNFKVQQIGAIFALTLIVIVFAMTSLFPQISSAATTDPAVDSRRRRLHTFLQCLGQNVIDEDDPISDYGDLFDNNEDTKEVVVVGFDRDSGNGVMTCDTVIRQGALALGPAGLSGSPSDEQVHSWFLKQLTGKTFDETNGKEISNGPIEKNRQALYIKVKSALDAIDKPSNDLRQNRFLPLVDFCFTYKKTLSSTLGDNDFNIPGIGVFTKRPDDDIRKSILDSFTRIETKGFLIESKNAYLGDIKLQDWSGNGYGFGDAFYPIGSDVGETNGYEQNAIVSCEFVEQQKNIIFANVTMDADGNLLLNGKLLDKSAGPSASKDGESSPSCESEGGESSWILCSALRVASSFLAFIDEKLNNFLSLPSDYYASDQVTVAWARMRNLAYLILVPIMLIMVISTALGFEFISAYTFKKALPRLVIAVLFIALSLNITQFLVIFTNEVSQGVLGLVTSAFNGASEVTLASLFDPGGGIGALFTGGVIVGGALAVGIIPVLLLYVASAGLALAIAVATLALRQMLLISFMVIAPLAILAWIFPGNDKLWKLWWGSFSKLLMVYPMIMFLIGSGRAFASLVQQAGPGDFIATTLKLFAYVGPYFFIPAMFKLAGGVFATISGMANDRSKGAFDRLRGARKKGYEKAWHRAKEGNYYKGGKKEGSLRSKMNTAILGATLLPESGLHPTRFKDNMIHAQGRRGLMESEEFLKTAEGRQLQDDDIAAATEEANGDEAKFRKILEKRAYERFGGDENVDAMNGAVASWKAMTRRHGAEKVKLAAIRSRFNSSTGWNNEKVYKKDAEGNFIKDSDGKLVQEKWTQEDFENGSCTEGQIGDGKVRYTASGDMLKSINNVAGNNRLLSTQLLAEARAGQTRAGRDDTGGAGYSDTAIEMDKLHRSETGTGAAYTVEEATKGVTKSFINGKNVHEIFRSGKGKVAEAVAPVMLEMTTEAINAAESKHSDRIAAIDAELEQINTSGQQQIDVITADPSLSRQEKLVRIQAVAESPQAVQSEARIDILQAERNQRVEQQTTEVIRTLAQEQMKHSVAASSSGDVARIMGDQVFNKPISLEHFPEELKAKIFDRTKTTTPTRGQVYDALRDDPVWGAYTKEYGVRPGGGFDMASRMRQLQEQGATAEAAQSQAAAEARAAAAQDEANAATGGTHG